MEKDKTTNKTENKQLLVVSNDDEKQTMINYQATFTFSSFSSSVKEQDKTNETNKTNEKKKKNNTMILWVAFVAFVGCQIITNLTSKISIEQYTLQLAFFQYQFMNLMYVLFGLCMMLPMQCYNKITQEETPLYYHWWYFWTGVLDSFAVASMSLGGFSTPGDWQAVLQQLTFPLTFVLMPLLFPKRKAALLNKPILCALCSLGAILLLVGVIVSVSPGSVDPSTYSVGAVLTFTSSNIFSTVSWLMKEEILVNRKASAVHFNVWNAIYMVPFSFLLWPLQVIPIYGNISLSDLPSYLSAGFYCFAGIDPSWTQNPPTSCSSAWLSELLFSGGTFFAGVFAVVMVKYGSATFQWAANVFAVPLTSICFSLSFMPASAYEPLTPEIIVGFVLVSLGFIVYGISDHFISVFWKKAEKEKETKETKETETEQKQKQQKEKEKEEKGKVLKMPSPVYPVPISSTIFDLA